MMNSSMPRTAGYVYVLKAGDRYKVGRSRNPERRLKQIQACSPVPVELVAAVLDENAAALEARMHAIFEPHRAHGEWFELDEHFFSDLWCILIGGDE